MPSELIGRYPLGIIADGGNLCADHQEALRPVRRRVQVRNGGDDLGRAAVRVSGVGVWVCSVLMGKASSYVYRHIYIVTVLALLYRDSLRGAIACRCFFSKFLPICKSITFDTVMTRIF